MITNLLSGLNIKNNLKNDPNRSKLISSIISKRMYIVPDGFAKEYVDERVMSILLDDFCRRVRKSSTHTIMNDDTINLFPIFYNKMDEIHPKLKLFSSKYLKRIDTSIAAMLLLQTDRQWKTWLTYNRKYVTRSMHGRYFLLQFYLLGKEVPKYILNYFVFNKKNLNVIENFFKLEAEYLCDKLIVDIEQLNYPTKFSYYLFKYWYSGGKYFPENFGTVEPPISIGDKTLMIYMSNRSSNNPSLGFETFMATKTIMSGLEPEDDDDVAYSFTCAVTKTIDHLFCLAKHDINILWAIPRTNISAEIYQGILRDDDYRERFFDLMETSSKPLINAKLYSELFGYKKKPSKYQLIFIRRGGSLQTLRLEDQEDNHVYNVCYTRDGLCEILTYSSESDITYLLESDGYFREFILSEMSRCSINYLNNVQLRNLLKCIIACDHKIYRNMYVVANYIFKLLGEDMMISEIPATMKIFLDNRMSRLMYPDSTKHINSKTLPYVPIRLLSGVIVDKCLSSNVLDGTKLPVLNMEYSYLDWVMTSGQMDKQFLDFNNIGYIADLSLDTAERYIQILSSR